MNKTELILEVAERTDVARSDAEAVIEEALSLIEKKLEKGEEVKLSGFGIFSKKVRKARKGTNPSSHEVIEIPATSTIVFRPSKLLKEKLN